MTRSGRRELRRAGLLIGAVLALGSAIQQFPAHPASNGPAIAAVAPGGGVAADSLSAPAQSALDRILGPGRSVVTASATYSPASSRLSTTYDPKHVAVIAQASASGPGFSSSVTQNGVGRAVTRSSTQGGQVQLMTVSVVVDSALRPAANLATIGKQVSAALGLQPSRGDKLSVVALPMPGASSATGPASAQPSGPARVTPYLRPGLGVAVAAVLLATLMTDAVAERRRRRRAGSNPALV